MCYSKVMYAICESALKSLVSFLISKNSSLSVILLFLSIIVIIIIKMGIHKTEAKMLEELCLYVSPKNL